MYAPFVMLAAAKKFTQAFSNINTRVTRALLVQIKSLMKKNLFKSQNIFDLNSNFNDDKLDLNGYIEKRRADLLVRLLKFKILNTNIILF